MRSESYTKRIKVNYSYNKKSKQITINDIIVTYSFNRKRPL